MNAVPFTADAFFSAFGAYNASVWPLQFVLAIGALAVAVAVWLGWAHAGALAMGFLAFLWLWAGVAYHLLEFTDVTPAGYAFGALFVAGGLVFAREAFRAPPFRVRRDASGVVGAAGVAYALLLYPLIGLVLGHRYPLSPTFGAPCPSVIFTFAILFWADGRVPGTALVAPTLWAVIGGSAALQWGMLEDLAMPAIALIAVVLIVRRNRRLGARRAGYVATSAPLPT